MSDIINQNTEPLFIFDMPDDETLSETISVKGEKGERGDPTKLSDLENDEGFITAETDELVNYYKKAEVDGAIDAAVDELNVPDGFFSDDAILSGKGTSITLNGTAPRKVKDVKLYGDLSQNGTPTPSNYVPIKVATGRQSITIGSSTYEVNLGKNLFDKNNYHAFVGWASGGVIQNWGNRGYWIECEPNTTYSIQKMLADPSSKSRLQIFTTAQEPAVGVSVIGILHNKNSGTSATVTTQANAKYLVVVCYEVGSGLVTTDAIMRASVQIELGSTVSNYAAYFEPIEVAAIDNAADYIAHNGIWYKNKAIAKITYTGAEGENWSFESDVASSGFNRAIITLGDNYVGSGRQKIISQYFKTPSDNSHAVGVGFTSSTSLYLYPDTTVTSVEEFKAWLAAHPTTVYYALATPHAEPITNDVIVAGLDALKEAQASAGATAASVSGFLPVLLELEAYADTYNGTIARVDDTLNDTYTKEDVDGIIAGLDDGLVVSFPIYGADGDDTLGDCTILKSKTKNMMVDCFTAIVSDTYTSIKSAMSDLGITGIDYLLITHYHGDHFGNIFNLINDGYLKDATVILPRTQSRWSGQYTGDTIKDALDAAGITWVECSNQTITLDDAKVELFNGSDVDYAYYDAYEGDDITYNDYSIFANVTIGDKKILLTGDADRVANEYVVDKYLLSNYDLLKDNHHGFVRFDAGYARKVKPDYVVVPASVGMVNLNLARWAAAVGYWSDANAKLYVQGYQTEPIKFRFTKDSLTLISNSYSTEDFTGSGEINYYVDFETADTVRTGSREHPFKTLSEAAIMTPRQSSLSIVINVVSLDPSDHDVTFESFNKLMLKMNDQPYGATIRINRCKRAILSDVNLTDGQLAVNESTVLVDGFTYTGTSSQSIELVQSNAILEGDVSLNIPSDGFGIAIARGSQLYFAPAQFSATFPESGGAQIFNGWGGVLTFSTDAIAILKDYPFLTRIINLGSARQISMSENHKELLELFTSDAAAYSDITTTEPVSLYPYYDVLTTNSSNHRTVTRVLSANSGNIIDIFPNAAGTETYIQHVLISNSGNNITLARNGETCVRTSGNTTITSGNKLGILKIYGVIK